VPDDHEKQLSGVSWPSPRAEPVPRRRTNGSESARCSTQLGAGIEYGFTSNWSAKLEYRYIAAASLELSHINEVLVGVNYRFGGP
jgi:opacity protein-like surface antigen